jgi:mannosyl-oligosaccharide alpha-1,2-mannosidase
VYLGLPIFIFYLDPIYRDWAWEIWEAIDNVCRTEIAYGALSDVQVKRGKIDDRMESFFLAETIKYLYLVQDPDQPVNLTKSVFNTEAHPLSILKESHQPILP